MRTTREHPLNFREVVEHDGEIVMLDTPTTPTTFELLFAKTGGRLNPRLAEACELWGISAKTYRNRKSLGTEPFLAYGHPMRVDLRDLAAAIDANRAGAKAAPRIVASPPKKRGRPTKAEQARQARRRAETEGSAK